MMLMSLSALLQFYNQVSRSNRPRYCYHAHTHWTLTYDHDIQSQASYGHDPPPPTPYTHNNNNSSSIESVGWKDRVETNGQRDGRHWLPYLPG